MKKAFFYLSALTLIFSLTLDSCVSSKKFKASEARANQLQQEKITVQGNLNDCNSRVKELNDQKTTLQNENSLFIIYFDMS